MFYRFFKRFFDILLSMLGLVLTIPVCLLAAVGILISDPGPVFYLAKRTGKNNRVFTMLKFRTMRQGKANESVFRGEESRVFPFGGFLRRTKIDELPQLVNILIGDMCVVGPRPAATSQLEMVRGGKYAQIADVPSGLTSPSALYDYIYGDSITDSEAYNELVLPTRLKLDLVYLNKRGFFFDLKMISWTVLCILASVFRIPPYRIYHQLIAWSVENVEQT